MANSSKHVERPHGEHSVDRRVHIVISTIESEFPLSWSTSKLARIVKLSPSHLRRIFKIATQSTPAQYLKTRRMKAAASLLSTEFLGVKEVMKLVGIQNRSHFENDFKERYGVPPATYRNRVRESSSPDSNSKKSS